MAYIDKKLNTKYKGKTEDEINGADAVLVTAKKIYDKDTNDHYNENIFNKDDNWKWYGTTLPLQSSSLPNSKNMKNGFL
ncbi:DEHA2C00374p [Debaryomyces hansenii CBS767]|uniref:DEHA2C00374p n=1 Tax=Debaryomyces hansenii (strain ATCC 36239 / CBS 767 / BCRC 21394 / JCM 1990 / NBRC 0083 / IGC 2968) TaxID=284592 RepID=B5RT52_DEBHA|nr:DEHA2C00374p [Debaryomyces hansenii CBS767]CAR65514.1 DEHA2C00374p [Debaryomyces hansenii CBS767]|eukprot:XP_002770147.1 DEHA2C00374p [Debaryomyces hansenii CBS767]